MTERAKTVGRTLGGLPLFVFSPAVEEGAHPADAPVALFLSPLGRPRFRFTDGGGAPTNASQRENARERELTRIQVPQLSTPIRMFVKLAVRQVWEVATAAKSFTTPSLALWDRNDERLPPGRFIPLPRVLLSFGFTVFFKVTPVEMTLLVSSIG